MSNYTTKQQAVIDAALLELKKRGINSICLDELPRDDEIDHDFEGCVINMVCDTLYWEGGMP